MIKAKSRGKEEDDIPSQQKKDARTLSQVCGCFGMRFAADKNVLQAELRNIMAGVHSRKVS